MIGPSADRLRQKRAHEIRGGPADRAPAPIRQLDDDIGRTAPSAQVRKREILP